MNQGEWERQALELARRLGGHNVEALLLVTDQTKRKHTLELSVGWCSDQVSMVVTTRWAVMPKAEDDKSR